MNKKGFYGLIFLILLFSLIPISLALPKDHIILYRETGPIWGSGKSYHYYATGKGYGKFCGTVSYFEVGVQYKGPYFEGYIQMNITYKGKTTRYELGDDKTPYKCHSKLVLTDNYGWVWKNYVNGPLYINGNFKKFYNGIWWGDWDIFVIY